MTCVEELHHNRLVWLASHVQTNQKLQHDTNEMYHECYTFKFLFITSPCLLIYTSGQPFQLRWVHTHIIYPSVGDFDVRNEASLFIVKTFKTCINISSHIIFIYSFLFHYHTWKTITHSMVAACSHWHPSHQLRRSPIPWLHLDWRILQRALESRIIVFGVRVAVRCCRSDSRSGNMVFQPSHVILWIRWGTLR